MHKNTLDVQDIRINVTLSDLNEVGKISGGQSIWRLTRSIWVLEPSGQPPGEGSLLAIFDLTQNLRVGPDYPGCAGHFG